MGCLLRTRHPKIHSWIHFACISYDPSAQGPIKVTVQELDGSFNHTLQIEENSLKHDIPCHSKSRRFIFHNSGSTRCFLKIPISSNLK